MQQACAALLTEGTPAPRYWDDVAALAAHVCESAGAFGSALVKGSRTMRMERVVQALQALDSRAAASEKGASHVA